MKRLLFQAVFLATGMIMGVYASGDVGLDLQLLPQVLGDALPRPEPDAVQVSLGKRHHTSPHRITYEAP